MFAKEEEKSALEAEYRKESKKFGDERLGYSALKAEISKVKKEFLYKFALLKLVTLWL